MEKNRVQWFYISENIWNDVSVYNEIYIKISDSILYL